MSRTYRRKDSNKKWFWFESEEEFNEAYEASKTDFTDFVARKPVRPTVYVPRFCYCYEKSCEYCKKSTVVWNTYWDAYQSWRYSEMYAAYNLARNYQHYSFGCVDYRSYKKAHEAYMRSDAGYGDRWCRNAPSWYTNLNFERPMRRSVKAALKRAYKYDTFDETLYDEWLTGAAWSYW